MTTQEVIAELKAHASEKLQVTYARHGMAKDRTLGVSTATLKLVAKKIKGQQDMAMELYATGLMEPMYLAGMIAKGSLMSVDQLNTWADEANGLPIIIDYTVPWVTIEHEEGARLALEWTGSDREHIACAGWRSYNGLVTTMDDAYLELHVIESLLKKVADSIKTVPDRTQLAMNSFVIAVGSYVSPLTQSAESLAEQIGTLSVDIGMTACKIPDAAASMRKARGAQPTAPKRKTIRC